MATDRWSPREGELQIGDRIRLERPRSDDRQTEIWGAEDVDTETRWGRVEEVGPAGFKLRIYHDADHQRDAGMWPVSWGAETVGWGYWYMTRDQAPTAP